MYDMNNIKKLAWIEADAPDAMRGFEAFAAAVLKEGAIPSKYKELMALAVALTTQCPYASGFTNVRPSTRAPRKKSWRRLSRGPCAPVLPLRTVRT
jgi:alkylhydroperoxidase/carboxymuconolactone decarboxylase family protein YurZ